MAKTIKVIAGGVCAAKGFRAAGVPAEIKYKGRNDVALVVADAPCAAAAVFTTNAVAAAPVLYDRAVVKGGKIQVKLTGAQLKQILKLYVEGTEGGFKPFNPGSLPVVSGIAIDVTKNGDGFLLTRVCRDGRQIEDGETFHVTCLNTKAQMAKFPQSVTQSLVPGDIGVKTAWIEYIQNGGVLAQPEHYIALK